MCCRSKHALGISAISNAAKRQKVDERQSQSYRSMSSTNAERIHASDVSYHETKDDFHIGLIDDASSSEAHWLKSQSPTPGDQTYPAKGYEPTSATMSRAIISSSAAYLQSDTRGRSLASAFVPGILSKPVRPKVTTASKPIVSSQKPTASSNLQAISLPPRNSIAAQSSHNTALKIPPLPESASAKPPISPHAEHLRCKAHERSSTHVPSPPIRASSSSSGPYVIPSDEPSPARLRAAHGKNQQEPGEKTPARAKIAVQSASKTNARVISGFAPPATSTQRSAKPQIRPIKSNLVDRSDAVCSEQGSERDRLMKSAPSPVKHTETVLDASAAQSNRALGQQRAMTTAQPIVSDVESSTGKRVTIPQKKSTTLKAKKTRVTPLAYAQTLCERLETLAKKTDYLEGKRVFYAGGDMHYASDATKKKMMLVRSSSS